MLLFHDASSTLCGKLLSLFLRAAQITRQGEIISENLYRQLMARKEHQRHVRELLAQAIVHKTLDMERTRQIQIKKKLEEISKIELVRRVKVRNQLFEADFLLEVFSR